MSTLYIRLPSKAAADGLDAGTPLYCQFAFASNNGMVEREGVAALPEMAEQVKKAQRVILLLAACDVTLLRIKVPPMAPAKLRAALPNLVEDRLMSDPAECIVVAGATLDGLRTVGVMHRGWLELLNNTLLTLGARSISVVPSQLCLPHEEDKVGAAVMEQGKDIEIAVRLAPQDGIGLSILPDQPEAAAFEVLQSLCMVVPHAPIALYVPQARMHDYQEAVRLIPGLDERITLFVDNWPRWIADAEKNTLDLMSGLGMAAGPKLNWRPWRWPLGVAAALLMANAAGLNIDWLRAKREAEALHSGMIQNYKTAYPKESVIVDPLAQIRQKMTAAQREAGQLAPDDFLALTAAFGEAWNSVAPGTVVASLEYHERSLLVKPKAGANVSIDKMRTALAARNLAISQADNGAWKIRSTK